MPTNDNRAGPELTDDKLRDIYRSGSQQSVPQRLDAIIIRDAKRELQGNNRNSWVLPWRRRIAFAAMVSLSLAIVLEMNEVSLFEADPFAVPNAKRDFATEAEGGSVRMREIGKTAEHLSLGEDSASRALAAEDDVACDSEQVLTPETWLACITQLQEDGFAAAADTELDRLRLAYPDFGIPH